MQTPAISPPWKPYREPLRATLLRTGTIALLAGLALALARHSVQYWPVAALLMLWPSFGGHWVELFFLNVLRPRIAPARAVQVITRLAIWFIGGLILASGMNLTAGVLPGFSPIRWSLIWLGGPAFIVIELVVHTVIGLTGRSSFYSGLR